LLAVCQYAKVIPLFIPVHQGPVIWTKFWKLSMLHVVLDWQKIYKIVLEKDIFLYFVAFLSFLFFVWKNLKNGSSER
jgi:hypothetical protein